MDKTFYDAARQVTDMVRDSGCSERTIKYHERALSQLAAHLDATGAACTRESVDEWLSEVRATRSDSTYDACATAAGRLLRAMEAGGTTYEPRCRPARSRASDALTGWAADAVSAYRDHVALEHTAAEADEAASHAAQFLMAVAGGDARPGDLTARAIAAYADACPGARVSRQQRLSHVRGFLRHAAGRGDVPGWAHALATQSPTANGACLAAPSVWPDATGVDPREIVAVADLVRADMLARGYSAGAADETPRLARVLCVALSVAGVPYTRANALAWLDAASDMMGDSSATYSRAALRLERALAHEGDERGQTCDDLTRVPAWAREEIAGYLRLRRREGLAESTIACTRRACTRLALFADARGVGGWDGVGADVVAAWRDEDPHETPAGRACYASKVRGLLAHLESAGMVAPGTSRAARGRLAPSERVVEVLSDDQVATVVAARRAASTPMQLRDAAMVALGMTMGMRASDVVGLSLSDIDWRASRVTFVQDKTSEATELPLTAAAGNAILSWLRSGRPAAAPTDSLFVGLTAPNRGLTRSACARAMAHTLGSGAPPFHCLRRTLATRMLRAGSGRRDVAGALGQADARSSEPYLSLDEGRMRMCALSPDDCGIGGGAV